MKLAESMSPSWMIASDSLWSSSPFIPKNKNKKHHNFQPNPIQRSNGSTGQPPEIRGHPVGQEKTKGNTLEPKLPCEARSGQKPGGPLRNPLIPGWLIGILIMVYQI